MLRSPDSASLASLRVHSGSVSRPAVAQPKLARDPGPCWVRIASGTAGPRWARAVTVGESGSQVTGHPPLRSRTMTKHRTGFEPLTQAAASLSPSPTRQVVTRDWPRPWVELATIGASFEQRRARRPCPGRALPIGPQRCSTVNSGQSTCPLSCGSSRQRAERGCFPSSRLTARPPDSGHCARRPDGRRARPRPGGIPGPAGRPGRRRTAATGPRRHPRRPRHPLRVQRGPASDHAAALFVAVLVNER
jgi:hypothetical protein